MREEAQILKQANQQLKEKLKRFEEFNGKNISLKEIISHMPGNVFWKDRAGYYLGCNNNLAKLLGLKSPDEIVGKRIKDFQIGKEFVVGIKESDEQIMRSKKGQFLEEAGVDLQGNPAIYFSQKIPFLNEHHRVVGLLGISIDITQQKRMEEELKIAKEKAEASSRAKSQFLAVVNHELRTPLTCVTGLIEFLKQDHLSTREKKGMIKAIESSTNYLLNLVNDMLDFSRLETGEFNLRTTKVNLNSLIDKTCLLLKPLAEKKQLQLIYRYPFEDIPKYILTDAVLLSRILVNLMSNAIKFTEKGQIIIEIKLLQQTGRQARLEILVHDTGLGIPEDKLNVIFEPFQQLSDAYTRQSSRSGTGLGLTIVEKLAELINGNIHVTSQLGKGSTFSIEGTFNLPNVRKKTRTVNKQMSVDEKLVHSKRYHKEMPQFSEANKPTILLVEDDPMIQFIHQKMLTDLGCQVDVVSHGQTAIDQLRHHHLAFIDISLPDMSGFEVIKAIRNRFDAIKFPIIALTVYTGKEEKAACLAAGANEFVSKPISSQRLKKIIGRYLSL